MSEGSKERAKSVSILAVLPDEEDCRCLSNISRGSNWELRLERTVHEAVAVLSNLAFDAIITESRFADGRCWNELLHGLQSQINPPPLIVVDRCADEKLWAEALNLGAFDVLAKPFEAKEVLHVLEMACRFSNRLAHKASVPTLPPGTVGVHKSVRGLPRLVS